MRRDYLSLSLILLGLFAGCAEVSDSDNSSSCTTTCRSDQVCKLDVCYNTCSSNKPCEVSESCLNNICVSADVKCAPDTRQCSADGRSVELCADGYQFTVEKTCRDDESCEIGVCVRNACENDTMRCRNNNVEICRNNAFQLFSECAAPQVCMDTSFECEVPPECSNGIRRCDENGNVQICDNEHWVGYQTCKTGFSCSNSSLDCVETAACESGTKKCNDNNVYECINARWQMSLKCPDGTTCDDGACVSDECIDGQQRCFESGNLNFVQVCSNGVYDGIPCKNSEICMMHGEEAKCVKNECEVAYKCENNTLYKCSNNEFKEAKSCTSTQYCDASSAECKPKCGNGIVDTDAGEECDGIAFRSDLSCSSKLANSVGDLKCTLNCKVDASSCSVACVSETTQCDGGIFKSCVNERWTSTNCAAAGQLCSLRGCYTPTYTGNWDYVQDFESLQTISTTYSTENNFTDNGIGWEITARTNPVDSGSNYGIDGDVSVVLHAKKSTFIKFNNIPKKVAKLEFDWRGWGGNNDKGVLNVFVNGTPKKSIEFAQSDKDVDKYTLDINDTLKSVELSLVSANSGRIIIDNIRWTYQ